MQKYADSYSARTYTNETGGVQLAAWGALADEGASNVLTHTVDTGAVLTLIQICKQRERCGGGLRKYIFKHF